MCMERRNKENQNRQRKGLEKQDAADKNDPLPLKEGKTVKLDSPPDPLHDLAILPF